jgi:hypothetical protein
MRIAPNFVDVEYLNAPETSIGSPAAANADASPFIFNSIFLDVLATPGSHSCVSGSLRHALGLEESIPIFVVLQGVMVYFGITLNHDW